MPTIGDLLKPTGRKAMKGISLRDRAKAFRATVYNALDADADQKANAWGRKQLKRMKYQRRHGLLEAAPVITR